jgi:chromosome partitioning protein
MRTIAIMNQKGGSGKTTTAVNLAAALGEKKKRVLVVDLDPQANATTWLGVHPENKGILHVFLGDKTLDELVEETVAPGVDIVPSSSWLVGVEKAVAGEVGAETILRRAIGKLEGPWDLVLMDCPPSLGMLSISALTACERILVPVSAEVLSLSGVAQLLQTVEAVKDRLNSDLSVAGYLVCRVDNRTRHASEVEGQLRERFGDDVYKTVIRENVRLTECPSFGQPITQYDSASAGAKDYRALADEVLNREKRG